MKPEKPLAVQPNLHQEPKKADQKKGKGDGFMEHDLRLLISLRLDQFHTAVKALEILHGTLFNLD